MEKRKIIGSVIGIILFAMLMIGITYAFFSAMASNNTKISGEAQVLNLTLSVNKVVDGGNLIPMDDSDLSKAITYTTPCIDKNGYGACHIYKIDVTNTSNESINVSSSIAFTLNSMNNLKWQEMESQTSIGTITGASNGIEATLAKTKETNWRNEDTIEGNNTKTYYIAVWISNTTSSQNTTDNGDYNATLTFKVGEGEIKATFIDKDKPASETIMALSQGDSWESGASGVYATNSYTDTDDSTKYHEYRYIGANVNNYVSFNNDMYRIIGVFDSNSHGRDGEYLVKLIAVNPLGGNTWGTFNTSNTSGEYSGYASDWTGTTKGIKANLNILLNEYFVNKAVTSSTYGNCGNWTYYYYDTNYRTNDCSDIVGYGIDSSLREYIETTTWYLYGSGDHQSKQNWYKCERGGNSCTSANSGAYSPTFDAKIGLMYVSDYLYASGYYSSSSTPISTNYSFGNQNWLYKGPEWTITSTSDGTYVWFVHRGYILNNYTVYPFRPSFYLKSEIKISGGNGTFDDPYTLGCDDCTI